MPKVSVIIPFYNREEYLPTCIDSVLRQTLNDIEIILVDDGSTDSSHAICQEYAQKDNRVIILTQKNQGPGPARNNGIKEAKSEFVMFLDSDDYYPENDILEALYNNAKKHNVLICGGSFSSLCNNIVNKKYSGIFSDYTFTKDGVIEYKNYQYDYGYHRFLYNLKFLKDNDLYFPDYRRFEDPPFLAKVLSTAKVFYAISKVTYMLRQGHKKFKLSEKAKKDLLKGIDDNLKFAQKQNLDKLYYLTCERLNQHAEAFDISDLFNIHLKKILKSLDYDVIYKYNPNFKTSSKFNFSKNILQNIFSIKNNSEHKVVTILGIKIKKNDKFKYLYSCMTNMNNELKNINNCLKDMNNKLDVFNQAINLTNNYLTEKPIQNIRKHLFNVAGKQTAEYVIKNMSTVPYFKNNLELLTYALSKVQIDGLYLEFGVYSGNTINHIAGEINNKSVYGFDSFEGLPEDWRSGFEKGMFKVQNLPEVKTNVSLIKGLFDETIPEFVSDHKDKCAFVHIDCDLYSSTKTVFDNFSEQIVSGTVIVFDEYFNYPNWQEHEYKAFKEFIEKKNLKYEYLGYVYTHEQVAVKIL